MLSTSYLKKWHKTIKRTFSGVESLCLSFSKYCWMRFDTTFWSSFSLRLRVARTGSILWHHLDQQHLYVKIKDDCRSWSKFKQNKLMTNIINYTGLRSPDCKEAKILVRILAGCRRLFSWNVKRTKPLLVSCISDKGRYSSTELDLLEPDVSLSSFSPALDKLFHGENMIIFSKGKQ